MSLFWGGGVIYDLNLEISFLFSLCFSGDLFSLVGTTVTFLLCSGTRTLFIESENFMNSRLDWLRISGAPPQPVWTNTSSHSCNLLGRVTFSHQYSSTFLVYGELESKYQPRVATEVSEIREAIWCPAGLQAKPFKQHRKWLYDTLRTSLALK